MPAKKFLSKDMILTAMRKTRSNRAAARSLHVSLNHYRKYAKTYVDAESGLTLYELHKNPSGKGIPKFLSNKGKEPPLLDIIEGRIPHYHFTTERIKQRLFFEGYLEEVCNKCGFKEKRVLDYKIPLLLSYKDRSKDNLSLNNIEMLCYNCYFLYIGNVFSDKQVTSIEDFNTNRHTKEPTWEVDDHMRDHLMQLGLYEESSYISGSEFISYL